MHRDEPVDPRSARSWIERAPDANTIGAASACVRDSLDPWAGPRPASTGSLSLCDSLLCVLCARSPLCPLSSPPPRSLSPLRTLAAILGLIGVCGCAGADRDAVTVSVGSLIEDRVPAATAADPGWAYAQRGSADFDGDGAEESVVLICDVTLDPRGQPLWEDGHRWQAYVEEPGGERTRIYARFVPNGTVTAQVTDGTAGTPTLTIVERTPDRLAVYEAAYRGSHQISVLTRFERTIPISGRLSGAPPP